jgi:hypothetical protein
MSTDPRFTGVGSTINALSRSIESRFLKYEDDEKLIAATFLDPRFKQKIFGHSEEGTKTAMTEITNYIVETHEKMSRDKHTREDESSSSQPASADELQEENIGIGVEAGEVVPVESNYDFDSCLDDIFSTNPPNQTTQETVTLTRKRSASGNSGSHSFALKKEIEHFCSQPIQSRDSNPLEWWQNNKSNFPELAVVANKMLCSSPSSVESERLFSIGGNVYTPHRNRLTAETGEKLMLLNFNLRAFKFSYCVEK